MIPPPLRSQPSVPPEVPAIVQSCIREERPWNRPIFRPPPLDVKPKIPEIAKHFDDWIRSRDPFWR